MSKIATKPKDLFLLEGISCLCFNKDFTQCALSKKDNVIYLYEIKDFKKPETWVEKEKLNSHVQYISGLDWNAKTNKILSCSYDKTCNIWSLENGRWTPSLLVTTTKLGFLTCSWNDRGDKFCLGNSNKELFISYYDFKTNWWACHHKKLHSSSVVTCKISPNSLFVISGSTDNTIVISSCYMPDIDDPYLTDAEKSMAKKIFTAVYKIDASSWITAVNFISSSLALAATQEGLIHVVDFVNDKKSEIKCAHSPVTMMVKRDENSFLVVCYDRNIYLYENKDGNWAVKKTLTEGETVNKGSASKSSAIGSGSGSGVAEALKKFQKSMFQKKDSLAITTVQKTNLHSSLISSVSVKDNEMMTTDLSGFIKFWSI